MDSPELTSAGGSSQDLKIDAPGSVQDLLALNEDLRAIEREIGLSEFYGEGHTASELSAKPIVLVIGQYSTGKTSLISSLCGGEYDGAHIGPEPTTERFVAVVGVPGEYAQSSKRGNYVSMMPSLPFGGLSQRAPACLEGRASRDGRRFDDDSSTRVEGRPPL